MLIRGSPNGARHPRPQPGRDRPEWVVAINRNAWSQSIGTAGRDHPVRAQRVFFRKPATNDRKNIRTLMAELLVARICGLDPSACRCHSPRHSRCSNRTQPFSSTKSGQSTSAHPTIDALAIVDALRAVLIVNQATLP